MSVYDEIRAERNRQDARWGPEHDDGHTPEDWLALLHEYTDLAKQQAFDPGAPYDRLGARWRERLLQVVALAVAAVESHDRTGGAVSDGPAGLE